MPIDVNFSDEVIYITSPTTEVTVQELVDAIRDAEARTQFMVYEKVIDAEGKADLGGGILTGVTMTLNSSWYIEFWDGVSLGIVKEGNVVGGLASRPVRCAVGSADTALALGSEAAVIVSTGSGLSTEEQTQLEEIHQIHGLESGSPLTVTPSSRAAASISQTITGDGETSTTVTRD